ncbi:hypothetical protein CPZ30_07455 [Paenibacillus lautus]|nr:hypothetical protein CPZ30_07455 [Paenibacillus lautus]
MNSITWFLILNSGQELAAIRQTSLDSRNFLRMYILVIKCLQEYKQQNKNGKFLPFLFSKHF